MIRIRHVVAVFMAIFSVLFIGASPASAVQENYTRGKVVTIYNDWQYPIGVWYSNPPGVGCACNGPWYPIYTGHTNWTEPISINMAAGYECSFSYYNDMYTEWYVKAPATYNSSYAVGDHGIVVNFCFRY